VTLHLTSYIVCLRLVGVRRDRNYKEHDYADVVTDNPLSSTSARARGPQPSSRRVTMNSNYSGSGAYWKYLINSDKRASLQLEQLCVGLASIIVCPPFSRFHCRQV